MSVVYFNQSVQHELLLSHLVTLLFVVVVVFTMHNESVEINCH